MSPPVTLRGITWDHTRGHLPLVAAAQRWHELRPGVEIAWSRRPLKAFEDAPPDRLARDYDLIVLDHPLIGGAAADGALLPLDEHLAAEFLAALAADAVGAAHRSYLFGGRLWALAVDAAAPVAAWRPDLLAAPPADWEGVLELARAGLAEVPAVPINCLMNLYALIHAHGGGFDEAAGTPFPEEPTARALLALAELLRAARPEGWGRNPIQTLEAMAAAGGRGPAYTPFTYGYSNYARPGYGDCRLAFGEPPAVAGRALRTTLGGTGLAVSARTAHRGEALAFAAFCASEGVQRGLWTHSGGQPGRLSAWLDPVNNALAGGYFKATLAAVERAWVRPRWPGGNAFQEAAGPLVRDFARAGGDPRPAVAALNAAARRHRRP